MGVASGLRRRSGGKIRPTYHKRKRVRGPRDERHASTGAATGATLSEKIQTPLTWIDFAITCLFAAIAYCGERLFAPQTPPLVEILAVLGIVGGLVILVVFERWCNDTCLGFIFSAIGAVLYWISAALYYLVFENTLLGIMLVVVARIYFSKSHWKKLCGIANDVNKRKDEYKKEAAAVAARAPAPAPVPRASVAAAVAAMVE